MAKKQSLEGRRQFLKDASKAAGLVFVAPALLSAVSARELQAKGGSGPSPGSHRSHGSHSSG